MEAMIEKIKGFLPENHPWKDKIIWYDTIESTNTEAKRLAANYAPHGTTVIADHQTGGRGRLGRSFYSPKGAGIYLSVILRPMCPPEQLMHLTCAAAVYLCDAVEHAAGLRPGIKWTNDLVYEKRKIAGILTELSVNQSSGLTNYVILGIGINCNQAITDFPEEIQSFAGSVAMFAPEVTREKLAASIIQSIFQMDQALLNEKDQILRRYGNDCITVGKEICLLRGDRRQYGTATQINSDGSLCVLFNDGNRENVQSGEVSIRGMYGYI